MILKVNDFCKVGTFAWAAPEVLLGKACSEKADIYSFGVLLHELASGESPSNRQLRKLWCASSRIS